jgi:predicted nucleotidyltransferase
MVNKKLNRLIFDAKGQAIMLTKRQKNLLKRRLVDCLVGEKEIRKIVIFGSFLKSPEPHDIDVAVFQDSDEKYLPLAMRYRKKTRAIAHVIPIDIIPLRADARSEVFMDEIERGRLYMKDETKKWPTALQAWQ